MILRLRDLRDDQRGAAMIEAALILGLLIFALFQTLAVAQVYGASTRVDQAAEGVANMVSLERELATDALSQLEDAAAHFLLPYDPPTALAVAQVVYRDDGSPSVAKADGSWIMSSGPAILTAADLLEIAPGLGLPGEALIVVRMRQTNPQQLRFGSSILPNEYEATAFAKTRTATPIVME